MARASALLERLRPVGVPGAAGPAGIPVDRRAEVAAELEPVFAALADVEAELERLRETGTARARRRHDEAVHRAEEIIAQARREAEAERAAVAARLRRQADVEAAEAKVAADEEAERIRDRALRRLPALVTAVVERVLADLDEAVSESEASDRP